MKEIYLQRLKPSMPRWWLRWSASGVLGISLFCTAALGANFTQLENAKPGDPSWELSNPATSREIEGYGSAPSINRGESIIFYVNTPSPTYTLEIFRMGWYGGAGAREMSPTTTLTGMRQPSPTPDPTTGLIECRWSPSFTLQVPNDPADPTDWMSGMYLVKLTALDTQKQSYILFVVRDDSRSSDFLFQNSVTTYLAYNSWGGMSLYTTPRAYKVSFNRPFNNRGLKMGSGAADFISWGWEYHMLRFLEREGYDVTYTTDLDTHSRGDLLLRHKAFLVVGHDEYWSWQMRDNVEHARDHGVSLGFFAANVGYWQVRFEPSVATGAPNRTMVCYKSADLDPIAHTGNPLDQRLATTLFRRPPVNRPEDALIGVMYDGSVRNYNHILGDLVVSNASHWVFEGTGVQNGDHLPGLLGYETDRIFGNAPSWIERLTHSPYNRQGCDAPSSPGCEWHYSDMTVYEVESGATVVATGTMHWNWGLDRVDPNPLSQANPVVQQATRNILARFLHPAPYLLQPRVLKFPPQLPGTASPTRKIVIVNRRQFPLAIQWISITGDFNYTNECQTVLLTGEKCVIEVSFTPRPAGADTGKMDIQLSDDPASPVPVQLASTQADFRISVAEGSSNAATVDAGQDANYGLSLTPIMGFYGRIEISCSGLPAEAKCSTAQPIMALDGINPVVFTLTVHTSADPKNAVTRIKIAHPSGQTCLLAVLLLVCLFVPRHRVRLALAPACLFVLMCAGCAETYFTHHVIVTAAAEGVKRSISLDLTVKGFIPDQKSE